MSRGFGEMRQIAFVVRDLEKALDYWTRTLGVGLCLPKTPNAPKSLEFWDGLP